VEWTSKRISIVRSLKGNFAGYLMSSEKQKNCSSCGEDFTCGAEGGSGRCWCEALPHLPLASIAGRDCFCPQCLSDAIQTTLQLGRPVGEHSLDSFWDNVAEPVDAATKSDLGSTSLLAEGEDYYSEGGMIVFTASYHRRRGYCCKSSCRHCPFNDWSDAPTELGH
jgi:hypothetical protein